MATALELGPEGWTPYLEALKRRPISVPSPQMVAERERLVDDARCAPNARPATADVRGADACLNAKNALFEAQTEEAFNVAERRVRLLCD